LRLFDAKRKPLAEPLVFKAIQQGDQTITFAGISKGAHRALSYARLSPDRFEIRWINQECKKTVIRLTAAKPMPSEQKAKE